ncbi:hypothetical protein BDBG_05119 [Blastomyces gilchristii SLH14081]|uniref:Leucine-rich repeat domain-containing protein n=1 Tax=Blastomyces gilchristii (strain SLH14081) TaxID=559298 RepID=A0A179UMK9_BLAGS|nr:uncharacterized protein BDBG_05119 [Blastomyces gilchristii SLH14081]OAT09316.1 hypothetical protein BDBG_05119 [Blastomyces gilchristii SLH14081]
MSPLSLSNLPIEILLHIALGIKRPIHRLHLALCSRAFSELFLRFVFLDIKLEDVDAKTVIALVQTLLRNPHIASCTQTLEINDWSTELSYRRNSYDPPETLPSPNSELLFDQDLIRDAAQGLYTASDEHALPKFLAHLSAGNEDAWARLPPFDSRPAFTRLSHVFAKWYDSENSLESEALEPFFFFPSVRRVAGEQITDYIPTKPDDDDDDDEYEDEDPISVYDDRATILAYSENKPTTSTVSEIDISRSNTNNGFVRQIKLCKNLTSFRFEHADSFEYDSSFLPRDFARSLAHVKHSLENLWLSYDDYYFNGQSYQGDDETFGSLAGFSVLKSLYISATSLIGTDALGSTGDDYDDALLNPTDHKRLSTIFPASLESLTLANVSKRHYAGVIRHLKNLVEPSNFSQYTPRLSELKIEGEFSRNDERNQPGIMMTLDGPEPGIPQEFLDQAEELEDLCETIGVDFEVLDSRILLFRELKHKRNEWRKRQVGLD